MGGIAPNGLTNPKQLYYYKLASSSGGLGKTGSISATSGLTFNTAVSEIKIIDHSKVELLLILELLVMLESVEDTHMIFMGTSIWRSMIHGLLDLAPKLRKALA
jgi:hypothetical protein